MLEAIRVCLNLTSCSLFLQTANTVLADAELILDWNKLYITIQEGKKLSPRRARLCTSFNRKSTWVNPRCFVIALDLYLKRTALHSSDKSETEGKASVCVLGHRIELSLALLGQFVQNVLEFSAILK